jgi:hypothetical protein
MMEFKLSIFRISNILWEVLDERIKIFRGFLNVFYKSLSCSGGQL